MTQAEDTRSSGRPFMVIDGDAPLCFLRSQGTPGSLCLLSLWHPLILSGYWNGSDPSEVFLLKPWWSETPKTELAHQK